MKSYNIARHKRKIHYPFVKKGNDYVQLPMGQPSNEDGPIYEMRADAGETYFVAIPELTFIAGDGYYTSYLY